MGLVRNTETGQEEGEPPSCKPPPKTAQARKTGKNILLPGLTQKNTVLVQRETSTEMLKSVTERRRVTAYCTAEAYVLQDLSKFLKVNNCTFSRFTLTKDMLYTIYSQENTGSIDNIKENTGCPLMASDHHRPFKSYCGECIPCLVCSEKNVGEVFIFAYGSVVLWGLSQTQEKKILALLADFAPKTYPLKQAEIEDMSFLHAETDSPRIVDDIFVLDTGTSMDKTAISYALAQSTRLAFYEENVSKTIDETRRIPERMANDGNVPLKAKEITKKIGRLFLLQIDINLVAAVLDTPEIFWAFPQFEELYQSTRKYMDIDERVNVLNRKCAVISDLLEVLRDQVSFKKGYTLEKIVVALILLETALTLFFGLK